MFRACQYQLPCMICVLLFRFNFLLLLSVTACNMHVLNWFCVWLSVQPPAETARDLEQCVDAPCEDAPPTIAAHTPSQVPEPTPSSATTPPTAITLSVPVPPPTCSPCPDPPQMDGLGSLLALGDSVAEGGASQGMATSAPGQAETSMAALKLESALDPTELSTVSAERWRSRGRGGQGSPRVLRRLNKVNLKKPPDQMCR